MADVNAFLGVDDELPVLQTTLYPPDQNPSDPNAVPFDLTGYQVFLRIKPDDGSVPQQDLAADILGVPSGGQAIYQWTAPLARGRWLYRWRAVRVSDGKAMSFPNDRWDEILVS